MESPLSILLPYIPAPLLHRLAAHPVLPSEPTRYTTPAAVLFADVSGFTPLTAALAHLGTRGAEELTHLMNSYFVQAITLIEAAGGVVVKFGGDALTVLFRATAEPLPLAIRRAYQTAEALQAAMGQFHAVPTSVGSVALSLKVSIAAGDVYELTVGGVDDQWEYVVAGDPLRQIALAEKQAQRGTIVVSPEAAVQIHPQVVSVPLPPSAKLPSSTAVSTLVAACACFVPLPVRHTLETGAHSWLAVLRPMTQLFINIGGLSASDDRLLATLHAAVVRIQATIARYQGSLARVSVDDKGVVVLVLFGAPPFAHENDALRAVRCALDLQAHAALLPDGLILRIGITHGQVFVGPVGSTTRREYTAMGDAVNIAARLMTHADGGTILCDFATYQQTRQQIAYAVLNPVRLKGQAQLVAIYHPLPHQSPPDYAPRAAARSLIGRVHEQQQIAATLDALAHGHGRVLLLEGEAGIGKSRLVHELVEQAHQRGWLSLLGAGNSIEQHTPYHIWRQILRAYFAVSETAPRADQQARVQQVVGDVAPAEGNRLPLLNDVLDLELPDTELTATLDPALRQSLLALLVLTLLRAWAHERPLLIVLEDAHWCDGLSCELTVRIIRALSVDTAPLLITVVQRPPDPYTRPAVQYAALTALPNLTRLALAPLSPPETRQLAAAFLGVPSEMLPDALADLIVQRTSGTPFYVEELLRLLRDQGMLRVTRDAINPVQHTALPTLTKVLPATLQGLVLARLDYLPADALITLKVAAVIGRSFAYTPLAAVLQRERTIGEPTLQLHLDELMHRAITVLAGFDPDLLYTFRHSIVHDVTYQTVLHVQRQSLHRAVAQWYEHTYAARGLAPYYALLAHHYRAAGDTHHERHYAALTGVWAADRYANAEAVDALSRALELTPPATYAERYRLVLKREQVYDRLGERAAQAEDLLTLQALATHLGEPEQQAMVALRRAHYAIVTDDYPAARAAAQDMIELLAGKPAPRLRIQARLQWGRAVSYQSDYAAARLQFEAALEQARAYQLRDLEAESLRQLGAVIYYLGDYETARHHEEAALALFRSLDDKQGEARMLTGLGLTALEQGDFAAAIACYEQAIQRYQEIGDQLGMAVVLGNLGLLHNKQGKYHQATLCYRQGLTIVEQLIISTTRRCCLAILVGMHLRLVTMR
ncbi:MAG: AAA family ATPase [Chloroflexaceae bacterium]|nr:AAA family ATPase [Chloroflexaceae bacterium]